MGLEKINRDRENEALKRAVHHMDEAKKNMDFVSPGNDIFEVDSARDGVKQAKRTLLKEIKKRGML